MQFYKQTTNYTCASAALLMILNHYKPLYRLSRKNEFEIWKSSVILPVRAASIYGLAVYAYEKGLKLRIWAQNLDYVFPDYRFKGYTKEDVEDAKFMSDNYLKRLRRLNVSIEEKDFSIKDIKRLVNDKKILMVRVDAGIFRTTGRTSNYVIVSGFRNNYFTIYDPLQGKIHISEEKLKESLKDLVERRKRDHKMIIFG